jgi:hypothetical protein
MAAHSAGCPGLSVSREDGGGDGCASQQQHSFLLDSNVVEVELDDAEGEEQEEEVTEEYLMEIDKDNVVIEVVQQHSNNSSSSSGAAQLFAKLIQEQQHGESAS